VAEQCPSLMKEICLLRTIIHRIESLWHNASTDRPISNVEACMRLGAWVGRDRVCALRGMHGVCIRADVGGWCRSGRVRAN